MSEKISRRDFLKLTLTSLGATFLANKERPDMSPRESD
jgi:hypothetical protein